MTDPVLFERDGAVATIRLNRPDRLNAIDAEAAQLLLEACRRAEHEDGLRALVLAGEGRAFLAGGDVGAFHEAGDGVQEHVRGLIGLLEETITVLDRLRMPVIARVQGAGGGRGDEPHAHGRRRDRRGRHEARLRLRVDRDDAGRWAELGAAACGRASPGDEDRAARARRSRPRRRWSSGS